MGKKILLDAIYINNSGGKILLDYLISELEKSGKEVFYLLDKRVENTIPVINTDKNRVIFLEASLIKRHQFYLKNKNMFSTVLCFGNLPPSVRLFAEVYTYFHQQLYIKLPSITDFKTKIIFLIKGKILKYLLKNTTWWLLQTDLIKHDFVEKFGVDSSKVLVLPFYPPLHIEDNSKQLRKKNSLLYVSNAPAHKNHIRLINSFCAFYDLYKIGSLTVTIGEEFNDLSILLYDKIKLGYPITNIGFVNRSELSTIYQETEYLIYPSLAESFGLSLVEAIENGCKIIAADLPYTHAICEPSLVFNPLDENAIIDALSLSLRDGKKLKKSVAKVSNNIDHIISLL